MEQVGAYIIIALLTIFLGVADAQGFLHAARIWQNGSVIWDELGRSALGWLMFPSTV